MAVVCFTALIVVLLRLILLPPCLAIFGEQIIVVRFYLYKNYTDYDCYTSDYTSQINRVFAKLIGFVTTTCA